MRIGSFVILLVSYLSILVLTKLTDKKWFPYNLKQKIIIPANKAYAKIVSANKGSDQTINRVNLIEIALKNMAGKMTRTFITIGGMAIGIAAIVFLVSVGYGLQELVTSRVARLDEMKQAVIDPQAGSSQKITDETISTISNFEETDSVMPLIALVARVNYKNSISDMPVYGVTSDYIKNSAIKTVKGKVFDSNELSYTYLPGQVAGISTENISLNAELSEAEFSIYPGEWIPVYEGPSEQSELLGYTKRAEGVQSGIEVWGENYNGSEPYRISKTEWYAKWLRAKVYVWDVQDKKYDIIKDDYGNYMQVEGYLPETKMSLNRFEILDSGGDAAVLGIADIFSETEETTQSTTSGIVDLGDGWVVIEEEGAGSAEENVTKVDLGNKALKQAVVNRAMLQVLGIEEGKAIGEEFTVSFVAPGSLTDSPDGKTESNPAEYEIVGVVGVSDSPYFYVPFIDLKSIGIQNLFSVKNSS